MWGMLLPAATVLFYLNSYPYYYVFVLAPAAVTIFPAIEFVTKRLSARLCCVILLLNAVFLAALEPRSVIATQRSVSAAVHEIFPQPVRYVDFCGFIGNFPRVFPFLTSGWGLRNYRVAGRPVLPELMGRESVPLLIDNNTAIDATILGHSTQDLFLPADARIMRENFVRHWGPIWVAGKRVPSGHTELLSKILVPGVYTLEGAPIIIDGRLLDVGNTIELERGNHSIIPNGEKNAILRWGNHLHVPKSAPPPQPYFTDY
jgi:hypothetical protein